MSIITQAIVDLLKGDSSLGLKEVYYGDQGGIPLVPSATVELENKTREYNQTGIQTNVTPQFSIIVYHGLIADVQKIKKELDQFVQKVENKIHEDNTLGGLVISGIVTSVEPGIAAVGQAQFYAHRLTWEAIIKERIGV
jgi:hypothetical protein